MGGAPERVHGRGESSEPNKKESTMRSRVSFVVALVLLGSCYGPPGERGQRGESCSVAQNSDGTATITCADGTSAIVAAGDSDGLDCPIFEGSARLEDEDDIAEIANICVVTGNITIAVNGITAIEFPLLVHVGGKLAFLSSNFETNGQTSVSFPVLQSVDEGLEIFQAYDLNLSMPALDRLGGTIRMQGRPVTLATPVLRTVNDVFIRFTNASLFMPDLTNIDGSIGIEETGLATISLPSLEVVSNNLQIRANPSLSSLLMPSLRQVVGNVIVSGNEVLTSCVGEPIVGVGDCVQ